MAIRLKRAYEPASADDGLRVLVDRLWPRGLARDRAGIDLWLKELAPSPALRRWFRHDPEKWLEFRRRYTDELRASGAALASLRDHARGGTVTLVYAARDREHNNALVLRDVLAGPD